DFGQPAASLAAGVIELEEAVLGGGVAQREEQVGVGGGAHVRDAPAVALDARAPLEAGDALRAARRRDALFALAQPPGLERRARQAGVGADAGNRLAAAEPDEDFAGGQVHGETPHAGAGATSDAS